MSFENKDLVAAQLTIAAMSMFAPVQSEGIRKLEPQAAANHVVAVFGYIRTHLEDGKQLPQLPADRKV